MTFSKRSSINLRQPRSAFDPPGSSENRLDAPTVRSRVATNEAGGPAKARFLPGGFHFHHMDSDVQGVQDAQELSCTRTCIVVCVHSWGGGLHRLGGMKQFHEIDKSAVGKWLWGHQTFAWLQEVAHS